MIYDGSAAARRTLAEGAALTAEHDVPAATWNRELDAIVDEQLSEARTILGSDGRSAHFAVVERAGARAVHQTAEALGCDLVLVPAHGLFPDRLARRCRRAGCARVIAIGAG